MVASPRREPTTVDTETLRRWPLPKPNEAGDKEERGRVLIVGGAPEMPGALILAATAALRAGAGKLRMATCGSIAQAVGAAVPEGRVFALSETDKGGIDASAAPTIAERASQVQAILIGPGMVDAQSVERLLQRLLPNIQETALVLDASALFCVVDRPDALHHLEGRVILTPHAGEMATMLGVEKDCVSADPLAMVRRAASEWHAVVALKGAETYIATPDGEAFHFRGGTVGLATSGSGDTLAGIIVGLAARGASPAQAVAWGVYLHGTAGERLAQRVGKLGFLARELLAEVPRIMAELDREQAT